MKTGSVRTGGLAVLVLALVLAAAACGGGDDDSGVASLDDESSTTTSSTATGARDHQQAVVDFAKCMREHGVDMPDPDSQGRMTFSQGPGDDPKEFEEAQKECGDLLQPGEGPNLSEEDQQVIQDAALAFAKCMRKQGVDMPDPEFGEGGGTMMKLPRGTGPEDPAFRKAQRTCQPLLQEAERKVGLGGPES